MASPSCEREAAPDHGGCKIYSFGSVYETRRGVPYSGDCAPPGEEGFLSLVPQSQRRLWGWAAYSMRSRRAVIDAAALLLRNRAVSWVCIRSFAAACKHQTCSSNM